MSRLQRDIAALADGSYERPGLRERIAADPELRALLDAQRRALAATRAARPPAPASLRAAVAGDGVGVAPRPSARRPAMGLILATAGVVALAVVALLPNGASPSVTSVAAVGARGPAAPAPPADPSHQGALRSELDGLRYPNWQDAFGWRSSGTRTDRLDGRATMTVYYANAAREVLGYTIVGGPPLPEPAGASVKDSGGTRFVGLTRGGRTIVTWRRAGHSCVISAIGVPAGTLLRLAEWRYDDTST